MEENLANQSSHMLANNNENPTQVPTIDNKLQADVGGDNQKVCSINGFSTSNMDAISEASEAKINNGITEPNENLPSNGITKEQLLDTNIKQQKIIEENQCLIKSLEIKCLALDNQTKDLQTKLDNADKDKECAIKEKEHMVIKYAVGEKNLIKERQLKEQAEKKCKDFTKEIEFLQNKLQIMINEKARICQMLDNKMYDLKNVQQDLEKSKQEVNNLESKLKWSQNSLKTEIDAHKECQAKVEGLTAKVQEYASEIEAVRKNAEETIKNFMTSQENRAFVLDKQVKEQQASLILLKHERTDKEQQIKNLQKELERCQSKQKDTIEENNNLSQKVQQLEKERLDNEQKLSELRGCQDQQREDAANLQSTYVQLEQLKLQLKHEQDQLNASNEKINLLKQRNQELECDMDSCRVKEADLLLFTQQLTDKNVRLQSEFTSLETKVQQLNCEQNALKRQLKEQQTKTNLLGSQLSEEQIRFNIEKETLTKNLEDTRKQLKQAVQQAEDYNGENLVLKRKFELSLRETTKELQRCKKKLEQYDNINDSSTSTSTSGSSLNVDRQSEESPVNNNDQIKVQVIRPEAPIDKQTLIEHIVKLQKKSAKESEKIDFLEEHVNTLVEELQKKTKLLQSYILREQSGILTSNRMDNNKAKLAKSNGVMASIYSSKVCDGNLTLELCLDINKKLQAVLEDALLKNITLKENVDTLGNEIEKLKKNKNT